MSDLDYILAQMRRETDALGFIPEPTLRQRFIRRDLYQIIRDGRGRRTGYVIHGPPRSGRPLFLHQTLVELDRRRRHHAQRAIDAIARQGLAAGSTELRLRCGMDLEANAFWQAIGFHLVAIETGGNRRNRILAIYRFPLEPRQTLWPPASRPTRHQVPQAQSTAHPA